MRTPRPLVAFLVALAVAASAACQARPASARPARTGGPTAAPATPAAGRPNIVFILTDDLAWNLVPYMPQLQRMRREGVTFTDYTVTDSLCCPSRSSIFTGDFPHDTGVFTNTSPDGGFAVFHRRGDEAHTYATALAGAGYATAMMGKYLNGYVPADTQGGDRPYVPPGWSEWDVAGNAYAEYRYDLNRNHTVVHHGHAPADYLTDVLASTGTAFIRRAAADHAPFSLEIATFAPHSPYTPAPADVHAFGGLTAPRTAAWDTVPTGAPRWLAGEPPLTAREKSTIDTAFRERTQAVQAVDRLIGDVRTALTTAGVAGNTYLVFSSDNGYHMGEYRLAPGKQTAFDTDVRVPLVVVGPGVPAGVTRAEVTQNTDLAPTFEEIAGVPVPADVDGRSLLPLLRGTGAPDWRTAALVEHHGPDAAPGDPDAQAGRNGAPTTYEATRTAGWTYVEYADGEREFYDRTTDPDELHNTVGRLGSARLAALHEALRRLADCHGGAACWAAGHVSA